MSKTISSATTTAVTLNFPGDNPLTITSTGAVTATGTVASIYGSGTNWTVTNSGSVSAATADGILLNGGATLTNNAGGVITSLGTHGGGLSVGAALYIKGGAGSVTNNGSVSGGGYGVALGGGGSVTNTSSITGGEDAVRIGGGAGTISNSGTLTGTFDDAIGLFSGGSITNASGAVISSTGTAGAAVYTTGGVTNVTNSGTVSSTVHGFLMEAGGTVTNNVGATITAQNTGVFFKVQPGTVDNSGNITGTGTSGTGVYLENNGNITNTSTGTISGAVFGAFIEGGGGTIDNSGSIAGASSDGVVLGMGGAVTNNTGGRITGGSTGVYVKYRAAGTVTNFGTIGGTATSSTGVDLAGGGELANNAGGSITGNTNGVFVGSSPTVATTASMIGTISNAGNILGASADGVDLLKGGSVSNLSGGTITGGSNGIYVNAGSSGTVTNNGNITATSATGAGVDLGGGGTVTNNTGGSISGGGFGVFASSVAATVTNNASLSGSHGVGLAAGGSVTNNATGTITGQVAGVQVLTGAGTLLNSGHISATAGAGADIEGSGSVTNAAGGDITGSTFGVFMTGGASTVTNAGTISGTNDAIDFAGTAANRLIIDPGAVFLGNVLAAGSANTLELAGGTGSTGSVGTAFANFQTLAVDTGGNWTLTGANSTTSVLDAGSLDIAGTLSATSIAFQGNGSQLLIDNAATFGSNVGTASYTGPQLQDFVSGDKVDLKNISSGGATFSYNASTGLLQVTNSLNQVATLDFQNSTLGGSFQLTSDGGAGTLVTLAGSSVGSPPPPPPPLPAVAGADVQWQNGPGGELAVWGMNGAQIASSNIVSFGGSPAVPDATWSVAGLGDLNGDGTSDFLWRNQNGTLVDWTMNGSQITSSQVVTFGGAPAVPNNSWSVAGLGDFNGDGKDDVLWRNTNGSLVDWTMNGSQVTASQQVTLGGSAATPDSSWSIAGIGDFNGDGNADVLWRNTNGSLIDWTMNGSQIANEQQVTLGGSLAMPDSSWSIAGIGDFNGDGKADVLWRNTNGTLVDWTMNGSQIVNEQQVTFAGSPVSLASSWQIAQIGDFNGNGASDILLRNSNGAMEEWTMNGAQIGSASQVTLQGNPATPPNTWNTLSKPTDFV